MCKPDSLSSTLGTSLMVKGEPIPLTHTHGHISSSKLARHGAEIDLVCIASSSLWPVRVIILKSFYFKMLKNKKMLKKCSL